MLWGPHFIQQTTGREQSEVFGTGTRQGSPQDVLRQFLRHNNAAVLVDAERGGIDTALFTHMSKAHTSRGKSPASHCPTSCTARSCVYCSQFVNHVP